MPVWELLDNQQLFFYFRVCSRMNPDKKLNIQIENELFDCESKKFIFILFYAKM